MKKSMINEYNELISKKHKLEKEIESFPIGYISKKKIKNNEQYYLQHRVGNKVISSYIKKSDLETINRAIERRNECFDDLCAIEKELVNLEKAAELIDKKVYDKLLIYKMCYKMDTLDLENKKESHAFACAMNAIEGVEITNETKQNIEKWINGEKTFLSVFEDTLNRYGFIKEEL